MIALIMLQDRPEGWGVNCGQAQNALRIASMRITFNGFTYDSNRRRLMRRDQQIALTPKALAVLDALLSAAPDVVSKEILYERLWPGVFVEAGNLHNLVNEVRGAIGDDDRAVIRTVHRVGYVLTASLAREQTAAPRLLIGDDVIDLNEGETIIGRERLGTPDVSRQHARIVVAGSEITIEDLDSKNGTFIGDQRIKKRTAVHDGDEIVFGRTRAMVRVVDTSSPTVTLGR